MPDPQIIREGEGLPPEIAAMFARFAAREPQPTQEPQIALGVTLLRDVDAKVVARWFNILRSHWWPGPVYNSRAGFGAAQSRNLVLADFFRDVDAGVPLGGLLFWDADQVPPLIVPGPLSWNGTVSGEPWQGGFFTEYLQWLVANEPKKQAIGGLYFSREEHWKVAEDGTIRQSPHNPVAYWSADQGYRPLLPPELVPMLQRPALYRVHAVGTGSMVIRTELLLKMRELKPDGIFEAPMVRGNENGQQVGTQWTEDVFFCHEVQNRLGEWIWLDTAMQSVHTAEIWITARQWLETHGYVAEPHPQSLRAVRQRQEQERRKSRIILPP